MFPFLGNWEPPQRSPHILNQALPPKLGNSGGTSQNKSLLLRGNIRSTVLFKLGEGMTCLPNRKTLGIMPAVCKSPKR